MKQTIILAAALLLVSPLHLLAQTSFRVQHDTVLSSPPLGISTTVRDGISATTGTIMLKWKVVASDFPADWVSGFSICDNAGCYPITTLWSPSSGTLATEISHPYDTAVGDFHMLFELTDMSSLGCYYLTVRMNNQALPVDTGYETFIVCNDGITSSAPIISAQSALVVYPNPAHNFLNLIFNGTGNVKSAAAYNVVGVQVSVSDVLNGSAHLDLTGLPPGLYFLKIIDPAGAIFATREFSKQ